MRLRRALRRYFVTGLVVIAPVGLTVFVLNWIFRGLDEILGGPLRDRLGFSIPGLGFILLALSLLVIGWVVHLAGFRQLLSWWNQTLSRFPVAGRIYVGLSQITQALVGGRKRVFDKAVLVPYPTPDSFAIAFITNDDPTLLSTAIGEPCVNVFLPTTPNPTSGFMLAVPKRNVREIDLTIEEATRLVISAGAVVPSGDRSARSSGLDLETLLRRTQD